MTSEPFHIIHIFMDQKKQQQQMKTEKRSASMDKKKKKSPDGSDVSIWGFSPYQTKNPDKCKQLRVGVALGFTSWFLKGTKAHFSLQLKASQCVIHT